ncbi:hypothetical protein Tco_0179048 [Tanacetum coccineum]
MVVIAIHASVSVMCCQCIGNALSRALVTGVVVVVVVAGDALVTEDLDTYDSDCDDISNAKAVLMANISNYGSDVISEKAQRIKPTLYDGIVISDKHFAMPVIDDEETLILEEESRSKILSDDFGKRFTLQQELSAEQAFWLRMSNPTSKPSDASPVKIEAPKELPKVILVNESLKKLTFHLARFDNVVKIRTIPDARTEEFFENNDLKAQLQDKDYTICKLKDIIKSTREKSKEENGNYDYGEIETKNVEWENRKEIVDIVAQIPSASTIVPGMFKLDLEPLAPRIEVFY